MSCVTLSYSQQISDFLMIDNAIRLLMKLLIIIWYYWISFSFILTFRSSDKV